jgi:hypothetical protein
MKTAVFRDKAKQEISFFSDLDEPVSVVLLVDTSRSMQGRLSFIKEAFSSFIKAGNQENEYAIMSFAVDSQILLDWTRDANAVLDVLGKPEEIPVSEIEPEPIERIKQ